MKLGRARENKPRSMNDISKAEATGPYVSIPPAAISQLSFWTQLSDPSFSTVGTWYFTVTADLEPAALRTWTTSSLWIWSYCRHFQDEVEGKEERKR
jgi:hypothetical protein